MQKKQLFNKMITGTAAVAIALTLAACGNHDSATSSTSSTSSSVRSSETTSGSAYRAANKLIRNEDYQGAYDRLNNTNNRSTQADNIATDLQNYMSARKAYRNGDYATASNNLKEQKSTSPAMRDAYSELQDKIDSAQKGSTSTSQNANSAATTSSATKSAASSSSTATAKTTDDVVVEFANKMGFSGEKGYQIITTSKSGNTYKFEVRRNNSDNTVSNMVGFYQYNSETGAVTKLS